jgi:hypothetical protein
MSEHRFTADEIAAELVSVRDEWLDYLGDDPWPKADRMVLMLLFGLIRQHFEIVASLKGTMWNKEEEK